MALRELTTLLDFRVDQAGLQQYERAVERIKGLAIEAGKIFGLYFAVSKAGEFVKEIFNAGKAMNMLNAQISQLVRPFDDVKVIQDGIYNTAQKLGIEYAEIGTTFRSLLIESQNTNRSQEQLLGATENIYKALRVGRATAEQMAEATGVIERAFRLGSLRQRGLGTLLSVAPELVRTLQDATGKSRDELEKMAKAGKLTAEVMIDAFSRSNARLNQQFDEMPVRLNVVFVKIRNELAYAAAQIWKMTNGFSRLGQIIWWAFSTASRAVQAFIRVMGGLQQVLEVVGIALTLVIGPLMLRQAILLTAQFIAMAVASWAIWLPWIAIGAAVVVAALAIHDFMTWVKGGDTATAFGDWLGPFEEFKKTIEDIPIVKFLSGIKDLLSGDFGEGWTKLKESLSSVDGVMQVLMATILAVPAAFLAWNVLEFFGIIGSIRAITNAVKGVGTEAAAAKTKVDALKQSGAQGGVPGGDQTISSGNILSKAASYTTLALSALDEMNNMNQRIAEGRPSQKDIEFAKKTEERLDNPVNNALNWMKNKLFGSKADMEPGVQTTLPIPPIPPEMLAPIGAQTMPWDAGGPGAAVTNNDVQTSLVQNNNISVTMQADEAFMAQMIADRVQSTAPTLLESVSRQITNAMPRAERATQ